MYEYSILEQAKQLQETLVSIRRQIHAYPEIGFNEIKTSALVADELRKLGIDVSTNIAVTGVVGTLKGKYPGRTMLIRADMDCLKLDELNDVPYKSRNEGFMHACGHDAHTTCLLGAAMLLSQYREQLKGNVKFVFQPAEEINGGAHLMVKEGVLENPRVDAVMGMHIWPTIQAGKIGIRYGALCAAPDFFKIVIKGRGGHAAVPDKCIDPISVGCQVYMGLQTIISRRIDPLEPALITVGRLNAGTSLNIIPDVLVMEGTVRTLDKELRKRMPQMIETMIKGITEANGAGYEFEYRQNYPPLFNEDTLTRLMEETGKEVLGAQNVVIIQKPTMGGEDIAYFQENIPGTFFIIGTLNPEKGADKPLHSAQFNIDEDILYKASAVIAASTLKYLE
ncbi:MAG: amidohydrolase [Clostridia bacterium BRH_c25]|nr:MAG: amidohydrolase [Clostridia bacterium BRH_c25]